MIFLLKNFKTEYAMLVDQALNKCIELKRKKVWDDIPKHFGLGSWDIVQTDLKTWMDMEDNA